MADFITTLDLGNLLRRHGIRSAERNFEEICDDLHERQAEEALGQLEERVVGYFAELRLPDRPTVYDRLVASLRGKDLIATFNWDPLLLQAYRRSDLPEKSLPRLAFLHGSVAVGVCLRCNAKGAMEVGVCATCGDPFKRSRILYPIRDKDYVSDKFIRSEWLSVKRSLEHAYIITVFGYGAPRTDAAAVRMLHRATKRTKHGLQEQRQFEIVDTAPRDTVEARWKRFFTRDHRSIMPWLQYSFLGRYPRRSCEGMMSCLLFNAPWPNNKLPRVRSLGALREWTRALVEKDS